MRSVRNLVILESTIVVVSTSLLLHLNFILALGEQCQQVRVGQKDILIEHLIANTVAFLIIWLLLAMTLIILCIIIV